MHFDFTIAFWPLLTKVLALITLVTFLWKVYKKISSMVDSVNQIVKQHHDMYSWYQDKVKPNGSALRGRHIHGD